MTGPMIRDVGGRTTADEPVPPSGGPQLELTVMERGRTVWIEFRVYEPVTGRRADFGRLDVPKRDVRALLDEFPRALLDALTRADLQGVLER